MKNVRRRPAVVALLLLLGCSSPFEHTIGPAPEHLSANVPLNREVRGESLDEPGDIDEFTFAAAPNGVYDVFLQSTKPIHVEVLTGGRVVATAANPGADTSLFSHETGQFIATEAAQYAIRVTAGNPSDSSDVGPYRLYVFAVDQRPEHVGASLVPGDTVTGEQIDLPNDLDEFSFAGSAGNEFNLFLQAQSGTALTLLQADIWDSSGVFLRSVSSYGNDSTLDQESGRFALPGSGTYRVQVHGTQSSRQENVSPYRLLLYRISRKPETLAASLPFGDSLRGESIELPGDVDEYNVTISSPSATNLVVQLDSQARGRGIIASLINSAHDVVAAAASYAPGEFGHSASVAVTPGNYVLRVDGEGITPVRGPYRIWLYRFSFGPEVANGALIVGDTITGEALNPPGDVDVFRFNGVRGEHINIALQGTSPGDSNAGFTAFFDQGGFPLVLVESPVSSPSLGARQSLRIDLPATGPYAITVTGASTPTLMTEIGSYRLAVTHVPTSPEHVPTDLVAGDSVTNELIDTPGDWDQFTLHAAAGEDLGILFQSSAPYPTYPSIVAYDPGSGDSLAGTIGQGKRFAGPFRIPGGGAVSIAVFERPWIPGFRSCYDSLCGGVYPLTAGYQFNAIRVNKAPEAVSAVYTVGDTVRGEAIDPIGDVDEFTVTATPGEQLTPFIRLTADPLNGTGLTLEVLNPASGDTLDGKGVQFIGTTPGFNSLSPFTVPASGSLVVRIRGSGYFGDEIATAPYEFFLKR